MRTWAVIAALALSACASAQQPREEEVRALTPAQLRAAVGNGVICRAGEQPDVCEDVTAMVSITETTITTETRDLSPLASYVDLFGPFVVSEPWFEGYRAFFSDLERQRASGSYEFVRVSGRSDAVFDPASGAWCAAAAPDARIFDDEHLSFAAEASTRTDGDSALTPESSRRLGQFAEDLLVSSAVLERMPREHVEAMREQMRGAAAVCTTYFGVVHGDAAELRGLGTSWPDDRATATLDQPARVFPADATLTFAD